MKNERRTLIYTMLEGIIKKRYLASSSVNRAIAHQYEKQQSL